MLTKKSEPLDWTDDDAIELFAPEPAGPSRKSDLRAEPLQDFASEVVPSFSRSSVPFEPTRSIVPAVLATAAVIALVATALIIQRVGVRTPAPPAAPIELPEVATTSPPPTAPKPIESKPIESQPPAAPPPPVVAEIPSVTVDVGRGTSVTSRDKPPARAVPVTEPLRPVTAPARAPERRAAVAPPPAIPRERPLSQDPGRLAAMSLSQPRTSADAPAAVSNSPAPTASPAPPPPPSPPPAAVASAPTPVAAPPPVATNLPAPTPAPAAAPPVSAAPPPAAAAASSAASVPAAASAVESNTNGIRTTLARYQKAFSALDAGAARAVWPTVNEGTLNRAFERLEEQEISFNKCQIDVNEARAEATCQGTARYVPRVGSRTPRVDSRQWRFSLVKVREEWLIGAVDAK